MDNLAKSSYFNSAHTKSVHELWLKFKDTALHSMRSHIPHRLSRTRHDLPRVTLLIRKQIRKCNNFYYKFKRSGSPELHHKFLQVKHAVQKQIWQSYSAYVSDLITPNQDDRNSPTNLKKFWTFIKSLRKDDCDIQALKVNDEIITDGKRKAEVLNNHFKSNQPSELPPEKGSSPRPLMPDICITTPGIISLLQGLNVYKASGPDLMSTRFLETAEVIAPVLKLIFEASLNSGEIPHDWKIANMTPIFKKEEYCLPQNYRAISLTSVVSKVMEHIISSQLMKHLENNHILYEFQHGFHHNRSWETQLVSFMNGITKNYDHGQQTDVTLIDTVSQKPLILSPITGYNKN